MELPNIGNHCSEDSCRQLDFLPVKCDACKKIYCMEHYSYVKHNCPTAFMKNVQVPVCPLCNKLIPGRTDELPDIRVSRHIDGDCQSDPAVSRRKVYSNKCSHKGCKQKELVPILCDKCTLNFCLRHRHPQDHTCTQLSAKPMGKAGMAAAARTQRKTESCGQTSRLQSVSNGFSNFMNGGSRSAYNQPSLQGQMSEEAALQLALQASMADSAEGPSSTPSPATQPSSQEHEDFLLAKAIAESEREAQRAGNGAAGNQRRGNNCGIS